MTYFLLGFGETFEISKVIFFNLLVLGKAKVSMTRKNRKRRKKSKQSESFENAQKEGRKK